MSDVIANRGSISGNVTSGVGEVTGGTWLRKSCDKYRSPKWIYRTEQHGK